MKLLRISALLSFCLFLLLTPAFGAQAVKHYALAYTWNQEIQRALHDRDILARALSLQIDSQLEIVSNNKQYGVIYPLDGTLAEVRTLALNQSDRLIKAGYKPAEILPKNNYTKLYHLLLAQNSDPKALLTKYDSYLPTLEGEKRSNLHIEKIGINNFGLVYHCWTPQAGSQTIIQALRLQAEASPPKLITATVRPVLPLMVSVPTLEDASVPPQKTSIGTVTNDPLPCSIAAVPVEAKAQLVKLVPARIAKPTKRRVALINSKVQKFLREQRNTGKLRRYERAALVAYDLTNDTYLSNINSYRSFQAASMIKPFVALAFFHQVKRGKLTYGPKSHRMMEKMIQQSNNNATNWFIRRLGGPAKCNALINSHYRHLFRKVRIREYIPPGGKTYKNSALPQDYVQFLKALWHKRLPYSSEMLRVMSLPGRDRIFWGTKVPRGTQVYNKTGSTSYLCGDMGILVTKTKNGRRVPYAIVGIVQRSSAPKNYRQWMDHGGGVIRDFSSLVYKEMKRKYNLQ
ncbi:serine hydrolase [Desulfobulbus rhabdoformis]|jgi:beta-lactamase class A|uniref:serine hydrolase n=1 Tax=Desulfobulbus rhabdoformis TaxID=34032 RepID=UPI00196662B1|nr:serine hydrolase [Desulfobulbus rhabdoformis]MBM9613226.1 serine hydrolase [Desulfobulbus rhabdoformis]